MGFDVIPAIDVSDGKVVRLRRGDFDARTVYGDDPSAMAKEWEAQGASRIHVIDLDGAKAGEPRQVDTIMAVIRAVGIPVQVGGGVRDSRSVRAWFEAGADRICVGTPVIRDPGFLDEVLPDLADRLVVTLDVRDREVRVAGWQEGSGRDVIEVATDVASRGVRRLLVTDISRDGMLSGPNIDLLDEVASASGVGVIASGGVSSIEDVVALQRPGIEGVVVGKALYTGDLDLGEAIRRTA